MFSQYSSSSSSSSKLSSSTMSNSTGSSPTTSRSVPHSSQDTISPLSVSKSTWTSASHSGQVPVGTFSSSPRYGEGRAIPPVGRGPLPCKQPNQSTRERWNLQYSFVEISGPLLVTFLCRKYFSRKDAKAQRKRFAMSLRLLCAFASWLVTVARHIRTHRTKPIRTQG